MKNAKALFRLCKQNNSATKNLVASATNSSMLFSPCLLASKRLFMTQARLLQDNTQQQQAAATATNNTTVTKDAEVEETEAKTVEPDDSPVIFNAVLKSMEDKYGRQNLRFPKGITLCTRFLHLRGTKYNQCKYSNFRFIF